MFLLLSTIALAEPVEDIRQRWSAVQAERSSGALAVTLVRYNAENKPWPAVGNYARSVHCYYATPAEQPYPGEVPSLATVESTHSTRTYSGQYLYDTDGALIFALLKDAEEPLWRYYWAGTELIRVQVEEVVNDAPDEALKALGGEAWKRGEAIGTMCRAVAAAEE